MAKLAQVRDTTIIKQACTSLIRVLHRNLPARHFPNSTTGVLARISLVAMILCETCATVLRYVGKTFTMEGVDDPAKPELRGIMLNVFDFIFDQIQDDNDHQREYLVYISYLEIYNEEIRDLLAKNSEKLQLKEGSDKGVYVKGLKKV